MAQHITTRDMLGCRNFQFVYALTVLALESGLQNIQCWVNKILIIITNYYQTWPSVCSIFAYQT